MFAVRKQGLIGTVGLLLIAAPQTVCAQACPADLSSLQGQIKSAALSDKASLTVDSLIAKAGSLSDAITQADQALSDLQAVKAQRASGWTPVALQYVNDWILIIQTTRQALQCRKENGG